MPALIGLFGAKESGEKRRIWGGGWVVVVVGGVVVTDRELSVLFVRRNGHGNQHLISVRDVTTPNRVGLNQGLPVGAEWACGSAK